MHLLVSEQYIDSIMHRATIKREFNFDYEFIRLRCTASSVNVHGREAFICVDILLSISIKTGRVARVFNVGGNRIKDLTRLPVASKRIQFTTHVHLFIASILHVIF